MIHTLPPFLINIVLLRLKHQYRGKVWVSKQPTDAGNDVSVVHLAYLIINQDLVALKGRPPW